MRSISAGTTSMPRERCPRPVRRHLTEERPLRTGRYAGQNGENTTLFAASCRGNSSLATLVTLIYDYDASSVRLKRHISVRLGSNPLD